MKNLKSKFGKRLRELREKQGLSQEKLAFRVELSREYISRIEGGKRNVSLEVIEKLATALDVDVDKLFLFEKRDI